MMESSIKRDLLFFVLLLGLIKVAIYRHQIADEVQHSFLYASASSRSLRAPMAAVGPLETAIEQEAQEQDSDDVETTYVPEFTEAIDQAPQPPRLAEIAVEPLNSDEKVNRDILQDIETAQTHIHHLLSFIRPTTKQAAQLQSMRQRLVQLKRMYKDSNSVIALLGPINTTGIITKENELERNLLRMINMTRIILQKVANIEEQNPYSSIAQGLEHNAQLLAAFDNQQDNA